MKKVLSVAMASAMVLGMGANAFAISYNSGSNNKADWPKNFQFDGELFVTDKDGNIVEEASTGLNDNESVDFQPGDVIWMPLYADNQLSYDADWGEEKDEIEALNNIRLENDIFDVNEETKDLSLWEGKWYWKDGDAQPLTSKELSELKAKGWEEPETSGDKHYDWTRTVVTGVKAIPAEIKFDGIDRTVKSNSAKYYINGKQYKTETAFEKALTENTLLKDVYVTVDVEKIEGSDEWVGKPSVDEENGARAYGLYTGNIDKNWSINLIEEDNGVAEMVKKAELYKATATDYASYSKYTDQIMPNAVYLKITLNDSWKIADEANLKYYVYVANNNNKSEATNKVWVSGNYAPTTKEVDFTWTNDASEPAIWEAKENGTATFDFADKAFFTVKMYKGETMYLDLGTAYDKAIAGEMDAEADSFYKFDNTNANFSRTGTLVIVSDDSTLVPYEIDKDGNFVAVDAEYVEDYAVAHTNQKVNGFVFNTKQLGNYVLSTEELGEEEEVTEEPAEPEVPETPAEPEAPEVEVPETSKPNPETGAEDFVGLAVSLAVVSVAAAGALALKK